MFRIGEFSRLTQVSVRMLRYYDQNGLLEPAETDRFTNYRLYSTEQIPVLNKIIFLRDSGFNVAEIAAALRQWDDGFITSVLDDKHREIEAEIRISQGKLAKIQQAKKDIQQEKIAIHYNFSIKSIPGCQVFSLRRVVPDYYAEGDLWKEMSAFAARHNIASPSQTFTIYHDPEYKETDVDIEVCAPVSQSREDAEGFTFRCTEPVPIMASTMVYGSFENIAGAYLAFAGWLQEHNQYRIGRHSRQIVHRGPWNEENPDRYLTEIQVPLAKI